MNEYMTALEAANKWGLKKRRVLNYCIENRIEGVRRFGRAWQIPIDAEKPGDPRKQIKKDNSSFFTLPYNCPNQIMTTLYNLPGSALEVIERLSDDIEACSLFTMELSYFQGEIEKAKEIADELERSTLRLDIKIDCNFILCLCAMYDGDVELWINARNRIVSITCLNDQESIIKEFFLCNIDSVLYDRDSFPKWFTEGRFDLLPPDCFPLARLIYLKWMLIEKGDPGLSMMCGPFIAQSKMEGAILSEIYCRILTAIGYHDRGEVEKANSLIDEAIALAIPDHLYSPFVEYREEFGTLLDERLTIVNKSVVNDIRILHKRLMNGWSILCRNIRGTLHINTLTQREFHAAKLAAKGLTNAEIAYRMKLSLNTVKRYISEAIAKTGAIDRTELKKFIILGGDTRP